MVHSCRADLHQVEQPLALRCVFWPTNVEGGSAQVCQAPSQVDYLSNETGTVDIVLIKN